MEKKKKKTLTMATGGQLTILSPDDYKKYYHIDCNTGEVFVTREGYPVELTKDLKAYNDLSTVTPDTLWNKRQTRSRTYNPIGNTNLASSTMLNPDDQAHLNSPPVSPIDGNTTVIENNDSGLTQDQLTQMALQSLLEMLLKPDTPIERKSWAHEQLRKIMPSLDKNDDTESIDSDTTNDMSEQLKQRNW